MKLSRAMDSPLRGENGLFASITNAALKRCLPKPENNVWKCVYTVFIQREILLPKTAGQRMVKGRLKLWQVFCSADFSLLISFLIPHAWMITLIPKGRLTRKYQRYLLYS